MDRKDKLHVIRKMPTGVFSMLKKQERNQTEENLSLKVEHYKVITVHDFLSVYICLIHFYWVEIEMMTDGINLVNNLFF